MDFPRHTPTSSPFIKRLWFAIAALNLFVIAIALAWLQHSLEQNRVDARTVVDNLAQVLRASLTGTIREIDLSMLTAADEYRRLSRAGAIDEKRFNELLARQQSHLSQVESLRAVDAKGNVRYGLGADPAVNLADREFYKSARSDAKSGLVIAKPVFARISKKWVIVLARRLESADGAFSGVVYVNLALDRLSRTFEALNIGPSGAAVLRDADLGVVLRVPELPVSDRPTSGAAIEPRLESLVREGRSGGTYTGTSGIDGVERTSAFRVLDGYPLYVVIGMAEDDYLRVWRQEASAAAAIVALFAFVTMLSAGLLARLWRRQEATAAELARNEVALTTIIDAEPESVISLDKEGRVLRINPAGLAMLDAGPDDRLHVLDIGERVAAPYRKGFRRLMGRAFEGDSGHMEVQAESLKGRVLWLELHLAPLRDATGDIASVLSVARDVTERKRAEELVHRLKDELEQRVAERTAQLEAATLELEEFSYSMSHDMRTPLRAINGYSTILLEDYRDRLDDEGQRLLRALAENANRMGGLIDDILRFLGMARRTMKPDVIALGTLAREAFGAFERDAMARGMRLLIQDAPAVWGDREMVKMLLSELLSNAVKFASPLRTPTIEVGARNEDGETVCYVRDNGVGFDMRFADKLFKIFERVHTTGLYEGSGIGLAIVKRIVDRHGGHLWAEGTLDGGATFYFTLPARSHKH